MPPAALSRYQVVKIVAVLLGALALVLGKVAMLVALLVAVLILVGFGVALPRLSLFGPYVCRGPQTRRCVALTFDDGPDPRSTPALLELLRAASVEAAFFGVGQRVAAHPDLAARIVREGHLLENHSYAHSHTTNLFTAARLRAELDRTQAAIAQATGVAPRWFRPPMGLSNPRVFRVARDLGLTVIGWTARGMDTRRIGPERVVARIVRQLRPGAIILLHDGSVPAERLVATVKSLLDTLGALGYEIVRLDKMLE
jgi:peptidoglycan/xylan/chitin deacetylase (PgdA/CDA1 family)